MKIKEVCKSTGLTDKAIRFYISCKLINPSYTENYAGRKNYNFNNNDIDTLNKIAILRKYDFSVNDIKEILQDNSKVSDILEEHISEIRETAKQNSSVLNGLLNASISGTDNLDNFCTALEENISWKENSNNIDDNFSSEIKVYANKVKNKLPKIILLITAGIISSVFLVAVIITILVKILIHL